MVLVSPRGAVMRGSRGQTAPGGVFTVRGMQRTSMPLPHRPPSPQGCPKNQDQSPEEQEDGATETEGERAYPTQEDSIGIGVCSHFILLHLALSLSSILMSGVQHSLAAVPITPVQSPFPCPPRVPPFCLPGFPLLLRRRALTVA